MTLTYTPRLKLAIPDFLSEPWHSEFEQAMQSIDRAVYNAILAQEATTWLNSTSYTTGDIVISPSSGALYVCSVNHTSTALPQTFAQELVAHPTYWTAFAPSLATQAEAEAGVENSKYMSPLRTSQAISALTAAVGVTSSPRSGVLTRVSGTQLKFSPKNGNLIQIDGNRYAIPSGGIAGLASTNVNVDNVLGSNLVADTTYLVFAYLEGGVVTGYFATGASHRPSQTAGNEGVEVYFDGSESSDTTLIGIIRTDASAQFVDSDLQRQVCSWYNQPARHLTISLSADFVTSETSYQNIDDMSAKWVQFEEDVAFMTASLVIFIDETDAKADITIRIDDSDRDTWTRIRVQNNSSFGGSTGLAVTEAEGFHTAVPAIRSPDAVEVTVFADFDDLGGRPSLNVALSGRG